MLLLLLLLCQLVHKVLPYPHPPELLYFSHPPSPLYFPYPPVLAVCACESVACISDTNMEFTEEEVNEMVASFKALGVKPKAETPDALKAWLASEAASLGHASGFPPPSFGVPPPIGHFGPKLSYFSGGPKDTEYDIWRYEVQGLVTGHMCPEEQLMHSIRRSVKGEAARILMRMGHMISVKDVLAKFDACFGLVQEGQSILAAFYGCKQGEGEKVALFAARLEDLLGRAIQVGKVHPTMQNEMLVSALRAGITTNLKMLAGYKFEKYTNFDALLIELRRVEDEMASDARPCNVLSAASQSSAKEQKRDDMSKLTGMVNQMQKDVAELSKRVSDSGTYTGDTHHSNRDSNPGRSYGHRGRGQRGRGGYDSQQWQPPGGQPPDFDVSPDNEQYQDGSNYQGDIICWKCGQAGHIAIGCRVIVDHMRRPPRGNLNWRRPMGRGRP